MSTIVKEIQLTDGETLKIQDLFSTLTTLRNLVSSMTEVTSEIVFEKILAKLTAAQVAYDTWFTDMQTKYNLVTTPQNSWNVDFTRKKLQLLG